MPTIWLCLQYTDNISAVASNSKESKMESDSRADMCCLGMRTVCLYDCDSPVNVQGYGSSLGAEEYPVVSGAVKYIQPYTGAMYHIIVHQAVHMPALWHHLMCPIQYRINDVIVNDYPKIYVQNLDHESHAVVTQDEYGDNIMPPVHLNNVTLLFDTEALSQEAFDRHDNMMIRGSP